MTMSAPLRTTTRNCRSVCSIIWKEMSTFTYSTLRLSGVLSVTKSTRETPASMPTTGKTLDALPRPTNIKALSALSG